MNQESSSYTFFQGKNRPSTDKLFERISSIDHLPSLPSIVRTALSYLDDPEVSMPRLARIIEEDQSIASRILKIANSPVYARSGKVGMIREAILLLGLNGIRGIILSMAILQLIEGREGVHKLWKHSFAVSVFSKILSETLHMGQPEDLATAGLLHDFGKVIYYLDFEHWIPDLMKKDLRTPDWKYEEDLFGASHAFVGFRLSYFWHFPSSIRVPIGWHNNPLKSPSYQVETAIVALADGLVSLAGHGLEESPLPEQAMMDALSVLDLSDAKLKEIFQVLICDLPRLEAPDF
jgi:HD-like signal output (HDOD) protein